MSLTRSLLNEFRPFFRMLDDPFFTADPFAVLPRQRFQQQDGSDPFRSLLTRSPNVRLSDETDKFIVEAEVPGVRKENLDVSIGDNGRSLTIKGNVSTSSSDAAAETPATTNAATAGTPAAETAQPQQASTSTEVTKPLETSNEVGEAQPQWSARSSFVRTIWLPQPVDTTKVSAKLDHGILQLEIPKLQSQTHRVEVA